MMYPDYKKKLLQNRDRLVHYALIGAGGGILYYIGTCLLVGYFLEKPLTLMWAILFGGIGGIAPELIEIILGRSFSFLRSWACIVIILLLIPSFRSWEVAGFTYGYLANLLWNARRYGLKDY